MRNWGARNERARRCGSGAAACPWRAPGLAVLARRFSLGICPTLRFCRGGLPSVRVRHRVSVAAVCPRRAPGVAVLSRRSALGARPALRFWRGVCHRFTPAVCRMAPNRTACDILRSYSAGRDRRLCVLAVLVWLSDIAGSLRVCAFLYGDLDGVTGDAGERGYGERGWRRSACILLRKLIDLAMLSAGSTLGLRAPNLRQRVFDSLDSLHAAAG